LTNHHRGNKRFRDVVALHRPDYVRAPKIQKPSVARVIVRAIRNGDPPGRFLRKDEKTGKWYDVGDKKATEKTSQALREKADDDCEVAPSLHLESNNSAVSDAAGLDVRRPVSLTEALSGVMEEVAKLPLPTVVATSPLRSKYSKPSDEEGSPSATMPTGTNENDTLSDDGGPNVVIV
jgi:hypothetical protein